MCGSGQVLPVSGPLGLSKDEMTAVPLRMAREVISGGNLDVADELLDADFVDHDALPGTSPGVQGFKETVQLLRTGFPDLTVTPQHYIVEDDIVVEHTESRGTHDGPFFGLPPTHAPVTITAIVMARLTPEAKMVERWGVFNLLEIMQQLGIVPGGSPPGQAATSAGPEANGVPASAAENRAVFARYMDGVWGQADGSVAAEVIHPQAVTPYNPQLPAGPAGTMAWVGLLHGAFPDLKVTLESVVGDEGLVCGRMLLQGTHEGPFLGVPPTGRPVSFEQMALTRMAGGQIVTTWFETDLAGAMQQLGLMPS